MDRDSRVQSYFFNYKTELKEKNQEAREVIEADRVHNNLGTRLKMGQADRSWEKAKPELSEARS